MSLIPETCFRGCVACDFSENSYTVIPLWQDGMYAGTQPIDYTIIRACRSCKTKLLTEGVQLERFVGLEAAQLVLQFALAELAVDMPVATN